MAMKITARKIELTDSFRDYIESKMPRLQKYTDRLQTTEWVLEKHAYEFRAEIRMKAGAVTTTVTAKDSDAMKAIDKVVDKCERKLAKQWELMKGNRKHIGQAPKRNQPGNLHAAESVENGSNGRSRNNGAGLKTNRLETKKANGTGKVGANSRATSSRSRNGRGEVTPLPVGFDKIGVQVFSVGAVHPEAMTLEEAAELLYFDDEHFLCFRNVDADEQLSILFRRKDGHFALAEPRELA